MDNDLSTFFNNLANAEDENIIFTILTELNIIFESKGHNLRQQLSHLNLTVFCRKLHGLNGGVKEIGKRLLRKVFEIVDTSFPLRCISDVIIEGLGNDDEEIKLIYLKFLVSASQMAKEVEFLVQDLDSNVPLLHCVAEKMSDDSVGVAKLAAIVIKTIFISCNQESRVFTESYMKIFLTHLNKGSVIRFRIYEVFVEVFLSKNEIMQNEYVGAVFESLVNEMNSDDILSQLNCLDMLSQVACASPNVLENMSKRGTLQNIINIFETVESDPLKEMLIPGAVKFFGTIAIKNPSYIIQNYPEFVEFIFTTMDLKDPMLSALCFETITHICSSADGLKLLAGTSNKFSHAIRSAGEIIKSPAEEPIKRRILDAFSVLFNNDDAVIDNSVLTIRETAYRNISQNPIMLLLETCKQPFPSIRCSSLEVLSHLSVYPWIEEDMALTPGFLEYLLDRRTEQEKQGKELKYSILKSLSKSPTSKDNFGIEYYKRICQYVKDGPFYSAQETAVEFDEAN